MKGLLLAGFSVLVSSLSFGQVSSIANGDWNNINTWDCGCVPDFNEATITINHNVTVTADVTIDETVISTGGSLTINGGVVLTLNEDFVTSPLTVDAGRTLTVIGTLDGSGLIISPIVVNGNIVNSGVISSPDASVMTFGSGSNYTHSHTSGGNIPLATWDATSNLLVNGMNASTPSAPGNLNQSFGNFTWNCPAQGAAVSFGGQLTSIQGTLTFASSFNKPIRFNNAGPGYALSIGADFINQGSPLILTTSSTAGATTVTVARDFTQSGGSLTFRATNDFDVTLRVGRNFSKTVGAFAGGTGAGVSTLSFNGGGVQTCTITGTPTATTNFEVINNSTLNMGTSVFTGTTNTFSLASGSTLGVGATDASGAIQTGTSAGNIRVGGTRTYSSGSTIVYNGSAAQFIGNGHPSTSGVKTQILNSNGVSLATAVIIGGELDLVDLAGTNNLSVGAQTLTLNGAFTPHDNFLNVTSSSNLVINGTGTFGTLALTGSTTINNLTMDRQSSGTVTLGSSLAIAGAFTQTNGDLIVGGNTLTISGNYGPSAPGGDLSVTGTSTIVVDNTGTLPTDVGFAGTALGTLTLNRSGATFPTTSSITITNLNLTAGTFSNGAGISMATGGTITRIGGSMAMSPNNTTNTYNVVYTSGTINSGPELPSNTTALANLSKTGSGTLTLASNITVNGTLTLSSGSFAAGTNSIDLKGNFVSSATSTLTSSALTFSGNTILSGSTSPTFGAITISGTFTPSINYQVNGNLVNNGTLSAGSGTVTFGGTTAISGSSTSSFNNISIGGTLTAPSGTMNIAGSFSNNGTFNHNNGTVAFNGTTVINGSNTTSLFHTNITGTLTAPASTLNIAGNFSNTGTFNDNGGTVLFNGTTSSQSITGTYGMNNINVSNPSGVNNNGAINLSGTLTLVSSGVFDADGSGSGILTIRSTAINGGGRIAELPTPANFSGLVTVERFVNGPDSWRYLSMPLTNGNVGIWQSTFPVTGNFSNASPNGVNGVEFSNSPSIYSFNSATQAYVAVGSGGTTSSTSLSNLTGYSVYTYLTGNFTISARGNIRTGNATVPIASSGYALVPNPYPSAIDWDNINRTGLNSTMSIRVSNNVYATYVAGGPPTNAPFAGWTGEVATGQAFWIQSSGATALNLTESAKTGNQYQFLRDREPENYVRIVLASESQRDEAVIWFKEGASQGFDDAFDGLKMRNGYFEPDEQRAAYLNVSTFSGADEFDYAINALAPLSCNNSMKLRVRDVSSGMHSLRFQDMETMTLGYQVVLVDHFLSTESVVTNGFVYNFEVTDNEASFGDSRFTLRFAVQESIPINTQKPGLSVASACDADHVEVSVESQKDVYYQFLKEEATVGEALQGTGDMLIFKISKNDLSAGLNTLSLKASTGLGCEYLTYGNILVYNFTPPETVSIMTADNNKLVSSAEEGNQWFKDGQPIGGATEQVYEVVESGDYSVEVYFDGCLVASEKLTFQITGIEEPEPEISVYPNPVENRLTVILPEKLADNLRAISVHDARGGRILDHESHPDLLSGNVKTIDLSNVPGGVYLLSVTSGRTYHFKIIKR